MLQIHACDIKKILDVSSEVAKSRHTHFEAEIIFQITMNFITRCDIWVNERRELEIRVKLGRWIVRVTIISRDNVLPQFPSTWQEVLRTLFKCLAIIKWEKISRIYYVFRNKISYKM